MLKTIACVSATLLLFACSPKKNAQSPAAAGAADATDSEFATPGMEYCDSEAANNCFLEYRNDGRSEFYTVKEQESYWLTKATLADQGVKMVTLTQEEYNQRITQDVFPRATYDKSVNLNMDISDADGNIRLPKRGAAGAKLPSLKAGKFFSDLGKKFKRRPGEMSGKGLRLGYKAIFGTFGAAALLPLFQSIWDTISPDKNGRLSKPTSLEVKMNWQGDSITDTVE